MAISSSSVVPPNSPTTTIDSEPMLDGSCQGIDSLNPSTASMDTPRTHDHFILPVDQRKPKRERASLLSYKHIEEIWDDKTFQYYIADATEVSTGDLDQYVFIIRDRIDPKTQDTTTFIDINSPALRDILREACRDIRGVSLLEDLPTIEKNTLFHIRSFLRSRNDSTIVGDMLVKDHLRLLVEYINETFGSTEKHLAALLKGHEITFDLLWALFEPNAKVYTTCPGTDAPRCVLYNYCEENHNRDYSKYLHLKTRFIGTDGKALGEVSDSSNIAFFRGSKKIDFLPAFPLQYHPSYEDISKELINNGRRFVSLIGIHHLQYDGFAYLLDKEAKIMRKFINSRIIVDMVCFKERCPKYPQPTVRKVNPRLHTSEAVRHPAAHGLDIEKLENDDFLICSPTVSGYCLDCKSFLVFAVAYIDEVSWSPSSYDGVMIPEKQKKMIWALRKTHLSRSQNGSFKDLVQGKGRGINFLLYGPPGVGKTLTAETVAETYRRPLYTLPAGQLGTDAVGVERILGSVFEVASRWRAIVLLDEADIFLARRSDNPHSNALVSVFLRELESFDGVLFLTTNRVQSFDEAIISRIHLGVEYKRLGKESRKAVWQTFLKDEDTRRSESEYSKLIGKLAEKEFNGREIRNLVFLATSLFEYDRKTPLDEHLETAILAKEEFDCGYQGGGAVDNLSSYV